MAMGKLYIVATPIGNLGDITFRAIETLKQVDLIAAEDTRHSQRLLNYYQIKKPLVSLHEHNETERLNALMAQLKRGVHIALVSDAGTPLINDPGFLLVKKALEQQINVVPIPGACAAIAALSVAGLPVDRFVFEGFLPTKSQARINYLTALKTELRTLIFFEAKHRIVNTLKDMLQVFGDERLGVIARELTKSFETIKRDKLINLVEWVQADSHQQLGEFVILVEGNCHAVDQIESERILRILLAELPLKQSVRLATQLTGKKRNALYDLALHFKHNKE